MLYFNFKNYEEFKELFGIQKHGNGSKSRKNKILLAFLKNKQLLHEATTTGDYSLLHISSMAELKQVIMDRIIDSSSTDSTLLYKVNIMGKKFRSNIYESDGYCGICEDCDYKSIRYINHDQGDKIYKMKASKFFSNLAKECDFAKTLPQQVLTYLTEEFSKNWEIHSMDRLPTSTLVVDDNFSRIYDSDECVGSFNSCMTDRNYHYFYENYVEAKAAYLENEAGLIIARCIIFTDVKDEDDNCWRLAERQYSTDGNEVLQRILINELIKGGYIDGYKTFGAGCGDSRAFVDLEGNSLSDKKFSIRCSVGYSETISYQDSFKFLNMGIETAYNYPSSNYDEMLDSTEGQLEDDNEQFDQYNDCYCQEVTSVYYQGESITCNSDRLHDFIYLDGEYYHEDDVSSCPNCGTLFVNDDGYYSEQTERDYCCLDCKENDESANQTKEE